MDEFDSQFDEFLRKSDSTCSSLNSIDTAMLDSASSFKDFFKDDLNKNKFDTIEEESSNSSKNFNKFLKSSKVNTSIKSESSKLSSIKNANFGLDTLEEMKEKQKFFKKIEEDNSHSTVDYGKLNKQLNVSDTLLIPLATTPIDTPSFINTTYDGVELNVDNQEEEILIKNDSENNKNDVKKIMDIKINPKGFLSQIGMDSLDNTFHQEPIRPKIKSILKEEMLLEINKKSNEIHEVQNDNISDDEIETNKSKFDDDNNLDTDNNDDESNNSDNQNNVSNDENFETEIVNYDLKNEKIEIMEPIVNTNDRSQLSFSETSQDREALRSELQKVGKMESFSNTVLDLEESAMFESLQPTNNKNENKFLKSKTTSFEKPSSSLNDRNSKQLKSSYKKTRYKDVKSSGYGPKSIRFKLSRSENFSSEYEKPNENIILDKDIQNNENLEDNINKDKSDEANYLTDINIIEEKYKNEINNLKQENFTLISKLEALKNKDTFKLSKVPSSKIDELQLQLQQEEYLRKGYEVENEKMYVEIKRIKEDAKLLEKSMFSENQKLKNEISNLREELTSKESQLSMYRSKIDHLSTPNTAVMGGHRIAQLEAALEKSKDNEDKLKLQYETIINEKNIQEEKFKEEIFNLNSETRINNENQKNYIETIKISHNKELDALRKKLKFHVENQEILDRDANLLKQKNAEITKMRCNIKELEGKLKIKNTEIGQNIQRESQPRDNKKILDLKKQVNEMERIIKNRRSQSNNPIKDKHHKISNLSDGERSYLENYVKVLESRLEERDDESKKSLRILQQKFSVLQVQYEERINHLENLLKAEIRTESNLLKQSNVYTLNREVSDMRIHHKQTIVDLEFKINQLQKELLKYKSAAISQSIPIIQNENQANKKFNNEDIIEENNKLKQQLEILMLQQNSKEVNISKEEIYQDKQNELEAIIKELKVEHENDSKKLKTLQNSSFIISELKHQLSNQEIIINHMKDEILRYRLDLDKMKNLKNTNEALKSKIDQLNVDLLDARKYHEPQMHHILMLKDQICLLEAKATDREKLLQQISNRPHYIQEAVEKERNKWQEILEKKGEELDNFQRQLDVILDVLQKLHENGISVPYTALNTVANNHVKIIRH